MWGSSTLVGLDPGDFETTGPLEYLECSRECSGPFRIVTIRIYSIAGVKWLEGCIRITELLLVFLTPAYFLFMARETAPVNMTSCILEIVDVRSDILVDFLIMLARVVDTVPPSSPWRGHPSSRCWSAKRLLLGW